MIITIDAIEGNSGQGQPVYSRTGLTTVYQYKVFQEGEQHGGHIDALKQMMEGGGYPRGGNGPTHRGKD
jgi:hypothetical protein